MKGEIKRQEQDTRDKEQGTRYKGQGTKYKTQGMRNNIIKKMNSVSFTLACLDPFALYLLYISFQLPGLFQNQAPHH